ncbi:MAG: hypothetical protein ACTHJ9_05295 [Rhodanobacter sp.]
MIQRHIPHPHGTFAKCEKCGAEPRHIAMQGRSTKDGPGVLATAQPVRHSLECRCGRRTPKFPSLLAAEQEWGIRHDQLPLTLPPSKVTPLRRRATTTRKEARHG